MAPLSHQLAGIVLEHDHYGSHLDNQRNTIDEDLEKRNFMHAGEVLCKIWNELEIDGYPVDATYVDPDENNKANVPKDIDQDWYSKHVRSSQYFLQIVKCTDESCCRKYRSNLRQILPCGFLPPPVKVKPSETGALEPCDINDKTGKFLPFFQQLASTIKAKVPGMAQVNFYL